MKKREFLALAYQLASPVLLMLLGLILIVSPDSAAAMLSRLLGWVVFLAGVGFGISAIVSPYGTAGKVIGALACFSAGCFLLANPLLLAAWIGRIFGILLILRGGRDFFRSTRQQGRILSLIVAVLGLVLVVLPMTTSRLVFSACGVMLLLTGIASLLERLREKRCLDDGGGPNIIDAL